jgi:hypothetical protein
MGGAEVMDSLFPGRDADAWLLNDEGHDFRWGCHGRYLWGYQDLNLGPLPYQGSALTD